MNTELVEQRVLSTATKPILWAIGAISSPVVESDGGVVIEPHILGSLVKEIESYTEKSRPELSAKGVRGWYLLKRETFHFCVGKIRFALLTEFQKNG